MTTPAPRAHVLLARGSHLAVVFRRGPSKSVLQVAWDRATDTFKEGQWFRGRIYERRCDLSPDGGLLVYFAARYGRADFETWTAVSRPPYFTALTLWPWDGAWNGGGLFSDGTTLLLNQGMVVPKALEGAELPPRRVLEVRPLGASLGEDSTVEDARRRRDGWTIRDEGKRGPSTTKVGFPFDPPRVDVRPSDPDDDEAPVLVRAVHGVSNKNGPWYDERYAIEIFDKKRKVVARVPLEGVEWADWDRNEDLLCSRGAVLLRVQAKGVAYGLRDAVPLIDLRDRVFSRGIAPPKDYRHRWE